MLAINNVELISDRPLEVNLREIKEVKRAWPDRAVIVFRDGRIKTGNLARDYSPHSGYRRGRNRIELRLPARNERARMGSAVGQVPEYCEEITRWVMEVAKIR